MVYWSPWDILKAAGQKLTLDQGLLPAMYTRAFRGSYVEENLPKQGTQAGKAGKTLDFVSMHNLGYIPQMFTHSVRAQSWSWSQEG